MAPNITLLSTLFLLLVPLLTPTTAVPTPTPQIESPAKRPCTPTPCASMPGSINAGWTPYCNAGDLFCTVGPGMITLPNGRCEDWCQPEPPKPKCPPPRPPPAEDCQKDPCVGLPAEGWEPYCYQGNLYCTVGPGMVTVAVGKCEGWCQPEVKRPEGCVE